MFPPELIELIKHLLTSKEVIGVTLALILYFSLVFFVARTHRKRARGFSVPQKKTKKEKPAKAAAPEVIEDEELGLEEE